MYNKTIENLDYYFCDRKSFYGKAHIIDDEFYISLQSYGTIVARFNKETKKIERTWDDYSNTTSRHIKAFLQYLNNYHNVSITTRDKKGNVHWLYEKKTWETIPFCSTTKTRVLKQAADGIYHSEIVYL